MPRKKRDLSARGHRDDAVLDLRDITHGLADLHRWHAEQRRHCEHLHALTLSALRSLAEAQRIDDHRTGAAA